MNKNDLISAVADSSGLTRGDAMKAVEGVFEAISGTPWMRKYRISANRLSCAELSVF